MTGGWYCSEQYGCFEMVDSREHSWLETLMIKNLYID